MATVATQYKGPGKKRPGGSLSGQPNKRLFTLKSAQQNKYSSPRRTTSSAPGPEKGGSTGLEGLIDLNQPFVEASKATFEDESKGKSALIVEKDYATIIKEKEQLAASIPSEDSFEDDIPQLGFQNITSNLCYRHSLLQALVHTPKFVHWIDRCHKQKDCVSNDDENKPCLSCCLRTVCKVYWSKTLKNTRERAEKCLLAVKRLHRTCRVWGWEPNSDIGHGDPDDQLGWMLNQMRHEMPTQMFKPFDAFHNLLLDSSIQCDKCGHCSRTEGNNERHLSLPIRPRAQDGLLTNLIQRYMNETVSGYRCEKESCKHVSDKHRIQQITSAPDVLLIQLKRFDYSGKKDGGKVNYRTALDLNEYRSKKCTTNLKYELHAVVSHAGSSYAGHYIAHALGSDRQWREYNDDDVSKCDEREAINPPNMTPYLLFYQRVE